MMNKRAGMVAGTILALGLIAGCGGDPASPVKGANMAPADQDGRLAGVDDEAIVQAIKQSTSAYKVEIENGTVRAFYTKGSKDDPTAGLYCSALEAVTAKDEVRIMVYPDGELNCANRHDN